MTKNELLAEMQKIVDENVQSYKTDFTDYDKVAIDEYEGNWWAVWVVRELGTQLKRFTNSVMAMDYIDAVMSNMTGIMEMYFVEHNRGKYILEKTCYDEVKARYDKQTHYDIELFYDDCYYQPLNSLVGSYDSMEEAEKHAQWLVEHSGGKSYRITKQEIY